MTMKKTAAVVAVAFGLSATATGSYAVTAPDADERTAVKTSERAAVKIERSNSSAARSTDANDGERRRCVTKKKIRRLRIFTTQKRVMRRLPRPTYRNKTGGLKFRSFNACTSSLDTDLDVIFRKKGRKGHRKWRTYDISVFWS